MRTAAVGAAGAAAGDGTGGAAEAAAAESTALSLAAHATAEKASVVTTIKRFIGAPSCEWRSLAILRRLKLCTLGHDAPSCRRQQHSAELRRSSRVQRAVSSA